MDPKKEEINRIRELASKEVKEDTERVNIISDSKSEKSKQHSIRIPKRFVEMAGIDMERDMFEFIIQIPPLTDKKSPIILKGELVRNVK